MGRPRAFVDEGVLRAAADVFGHGYAATSIDELVAALGIHRGSLYNAFGSKRGLFLAALRHDVSTRIRQAIDVAGDRRAALGDTLINEPVLDLLLVAAIERGPADPEVAELVRSTLTAVGSALPDRGGETCSDARAFQILGARIHHRLARPPSEFLQTRES